MKKAFLILPLVALATLALLPLNRVIAPMLTLAVSESPAVNRLLAAQLLTLTLTAIVLLFVWSVNRKGFYKYARLGDGAAPAEQVGWLGIRTGESWRKVGWSFAFIITMTTGLFMYFGFYRSTPVAWFPALPWVFLFSLSNSFSEEMLTRFSLVAGLDGILPGRAICLWSAVIFGSVHYFGTPGGLPGVLMAGFLGWILSKSMLETRGIGWAWLLHFLQDMVIIFALL